MTHTKRLLTVLCLAGALQAGAHEPRIVHGDEVAVTPFPGHETRMLAGAGHTSSGTAVLELAMPPKSFGAPPHVHADEDEFFYVLEGRVDFLDRERIVTAGPGTLVTLPRGHLHGFWNATDTPARLLLMISPGSFAGFFDDVVARIRAENPGNAQAVGALIAKAAAERGVTLHPDKTPPEALALLPQ